MTKRITIWHQVKTMLVKKWPSVLGGQQIQVRKNCFLAIAWRDYFSRCSFKPNFIEKFGEVEEVGLKIWYHQTPLSQETSVLWLGLSKTSVLNLLRIGYTDISDRWISIRLSVWSWLQKNTEQTSWWLNRHLWLCVRKQVAVVCKSMLSSMRHYEFFDEMAS